MAFHTFGPGLALDRVTMAPLPAVVATLEDAETGEPVQAYSMDDESLPVLVATNRYGVFGQFKVPATVRRLRLTFAGLTLEHTAWELVPAAVDQAIAAADDAELAKIAAQQAAALVAAPADKAVQTLVQGTGTLTRQALDALYMGKGSIGLATSSADGLMPKADKAKLDGLGGLATSAKDGLMPKADKAKLDAAAVYPTPGTLAMRNSGGQMQVADPGSAPDAANRRYVDAGLAKQFSYNGLVPAGTINGLLTPGVYYQSASAQATIANGYPWDSSSGTLIVYFYAGSTTYVVQEWIAAADGRRAFRSTGNGGTTWRPWNEMARIQDVASMIAAPDPDIYPFVNTTFKVHSTGYRYEVTRVYCGGKPRPNVLKKRYGSDFELTSPKGDGFICPVDKAEGLKSFASRTGADVLFNSTGWQTAEGPTYRMIRGVQIKDGIIYRDFETGSNRGRHALGVHADGTIRPYMTEDGDTAASMVAAGVVDSFTFGPLLVKNGVQRNVEADTWASSLTSGAISGRTILGATQDHDILLITVVGDSAAGTGVGGNGIAALAKEEGCYNAILLDGGGSTQAMANGFYFHPSSDTPLMHRTMGDCGLIYARMTQVPDSSLSQGVEPIELASGVVVNGSAAYTPGVVVRAGRVSLQGQAKLASGQLPGNTWTTIGKVPSKARPWRLDGSVAIFQAGSPVTGSPARVQIQLDGTILANVPVNSNYVDFTGIDYDAF